MLFRSKPLVGHRGPVTSVAYSPDGRKIISGSNDRTIRVWDAEYGVAVVQILERDVISVNSVAYSPDGRHIISGSYDGTIRTWDAETGAAIGNPLEGHTSSVQSVAYSPDGRHIISGSKDGTIRVWDAETEVAVGKPLDRHLDPVMRVAPSSEEQRVASGSGDNTTHVCDAFPYVTVQSSPCNPMHVDLCAKPGLDGWVRDSEGGLLYWVPQDCRTGLHSPARLTIPLVSRIRSVSLDFDDFTFGTSWDQIFSRTAS